jgi:rRNA-processing protein FCF1
LNKKLSENTVILIDTNLAILLCVGHSGPANIAKHKRLSAFDANDYDVLLDMLSKAIGVVFSPYVLSETSNLVRQIANPLKYQLAEILRALILQGDEIQTRCTAIVNDSQYVQLGMTDVALLSVLEQRDDVILMTVDLDLCLAAQSRGLPVINFNNVRDQRPDFRP